MLNKVTHKLNMEIDLAYNSENFSPLKNFTEKGSERDNPVQCKSVWSQRTIER